MIRVGATIEHHDDQFVGGRIVIYVLEIIRMACTWTDEHDESQCRRRRQLRCSTRGLFSHMPGARQCCATLKLDLPPTPSILARFGGNCVSAVKFQPDRNGESTQIPHDALRTVGDAEAKVR